MPPKKASKSKPSAAKPRGSAAKAPKSAGAGSLERFGRAVTEARTCMLEGCDKVIKFHEYAVQLKNLKGKDITEEEVDRLVVVLQRMTKDAQDVPTCVINKCGAKLAAATEAALEQAHDFFMSIDVKDKGTKQKLVKLLEANGLTTM
jgi:hypothetical protein